MNPENENIWLSGTVPNGIPVLADSFKLEADRRAAVLGWRNGDVPVFGEELGVGQSFGSRDIEDTTFFRPDVAGNVHLPRHAAAIGAEELGSVGWEMPEAEFIVRHGKVARGEIFVVRLSRTLDVTGTPAAINQFPLPVVDLDRVPRVARRLGGSGGTGSKGRESETLPVTANHDAFQPGGGGYGGEKAGIAFTNREPR